ncbi:MAG: flagellar basal body-associated protein FliL [Acidimicrobiia bacterium]
MADEDEDEAGEGKKSKKGKKDKGDDEGGKSNLVPAIVLALGLIVGGKMIGGGKGAATAAPVPAAHGAEAPLDCAVEDIKAPPKEGIVYPIESFPINLKDGHYLKVGIALKLTAGIEKKLFEEEGHYVMAKDVAIAVLGGRDPAEFGSPQAIEAAKEKITEEVRPLFECKVIEVLFTEFVTQ